MGIKTAKLNGKFILQLCSPDTEDALNGSTFESKDEWVLSKDNGVRYSPSCRYNYSTLYAKEKKIYFVCGTSRAAIQQVLISLTNSKLKFSEIYFLIKETGKDAVRFVEDDDEEEEIEEED